MLSKLLRPRPRTVREPSVPAGTRVYAVGDIHGRLDLLDPLLARIEADDTGRGSADTTIIFLGDLIDRGPASAGVVERLRLLASERTGLRFLKGNHEEVFLAARGGDTQAVRLFCRIGGRETMLSYGLDPTTYERFDYDEVAEYLAREIPSAHRAFLDAFEDMIVLGDYAFVHAGLRPDVTLDRQCTSDLRWIRDPFLDGRGRFDKRVVHGHTIAEEAEFRPHRIGIDTGAYATGKLTALGLEGAVCWLLSS